MFLLRRDEYLRKMRRYLTAPAVLVVTGLRRVGKSILLRQLADDLAQESAVLYIDKEDLNDGHIGTDRELMEAAESVAVAGEMLHVIVDEVQIIENWEKAVAALNARENIKVIISGSNAGLFSGELATRIAGRFIALRILPMSLGEFDRLYAGIHGESPEPRALFHLYRQYGGLPGLLHTDLSADLISQMQKDIYSTIALRDIISRHGIRDIESFENITSFAMDNVGSLLSANRISDFLKSQKRGSSVDTVLNHLSYLCEAFIFDRVDRFDIRGKKHLQVNSKYYLGDLGLRSGMLGYSDARVAGDLENLVYHELLRRGYEVRIGIVDNQEIDFVATGADRRYYIQVSYLTETPETLEREIRSLMAVNEAYPKILLTMDPVPPGGLSGILHIHIPDFLKGQTLPGE